MSQTPTLDRHPGLADATVSEGSPVEVRARFDRSWAAGFTVADVGEPGIALRRVSDRSLIPVPFHPSEVRPTTIS